MRSAPATPRAGHAPALAVLIALALPLFFLGIGRLALLDPDEPYYAVPALEMLQSGHWQVPVFHGHLWFDKPILFYWIVLGAFRLLGVHELAARIGSGVAALAGVLALYAHARRRGVAAGSGTEALLPAFVLATSLEYAILARMAITDMTLTVFVTLGMIGIFRFLENGRRAWVVLAGTAFGLACLTKGPVGLLLPATSLLAWSLLARRRDLRRWPTLAAGGLAVVATAGPWYAYMGYAHRDLLIGTFLGRGNLGRFLSPEHPTSPLYYLVVFALGLLPWSGVLPFAIAEGCRRAARRSQSVSSAEPSLPAAPRRGGMDEASTALFELCWFGSVLLVFSVTASRLATYVLPAFPPAALLIARFWSVRLAPVARRPGTREFAWMLPAIVGVPCGLLFAVFSRTDAAAEWGVDPWMLLSIASPLAAGSIAASLFARRRSAPGFLAAQGALSVAVILATVYIAGPRIETRRSGRSLVEELRRQGLDGEVVGAVRERDFSVDFYLGRTLPRVSGRTMLEQAVASHPGGIWVIPEPNVEQVTVSRRMTWQTVARTPTARALRLFPAAFPADGGPSAAVEEASPTSAESRGRSSSRARE